MIFYLYFFISSSYVYSLYFISYDVPFDIFLPDSAYCIDF